MSTSSSLTPSEVMTQPPRPVLDEMPEEVFEKLYEGMDCDDRHSCRLVCKSLNAASDMVRIPINDLSIMVDTARIIVNYLGEKHEFLRYGQDCEVTCPRGTRLLEKVNFEDHAIQRLKDLLLPRKVHIKTLSVTFECDPEEQDEYPRSFVKKFKKEFSKANVIHAEKVYLEIHSPQPTLMAFLKVLQPQVLKSITVEQDTDYRADKIVKMEQFKKAEVVEMEWADAVGIRFKDIKHLKECDIRLEEMTVENMIELKELFLHSDRKHFELVVEPATMPIEIPEFGEGEIINMGHIMARVWVVRENNKEVRIDWSYGGTSSTIKFNSD